MQSLWLGCPRKTITVLGRHRLESHTAPNHLRQGTRIQIFPSIQRLHGASNCAVTVAMRPESESSTQAALQRPAREGRLGLSRVQWPASPPHPPKRTVVHPTSIELACCAYWAGWEGLGGWPGILVEGPRGQLSAAHWHRLQGPAGSAAYWSGKSDWVPAM